MITEMKSESNFLKSLLVIERLEIGPIRLESQRLSAPYKVIQAGKEDTIDLSYHFGEDVFDPDEPTSKNLANMISAQVALNYGLFCKEIVFHGLFDKYDQLFLREMAQNTAREIFVNKFLKPNPFLRGVALGVPSVRLKSYLQSNIVFSDSREPDNPERTIWQIDPQCHAVLSSGGKDSLLSFGLLNELGYETHPIFINESGRHWFTALNAYRYFRTTYPRNARVWTNSDRVFAWMVRHLPFIRQDFSTVRSDDYPIRLWTVAVFLFGALPLLRKRGIGRLVIGNEYDTTRRLISKGICHYDGLYDQSRYFDNTLTGYFLRKGWGINQFSILRPLSELLIEKILVERYPHLQRHQVSCHAATLENGRVRPCGKCEKCRRIVAMLTAIGADPHTCGYNPKMIKHCLESLIPEGIHQERADIQQVTFLLMKRGLVQPSPKGSIGGQERTEIMKVRIDTERSPIEEIPMDLRNPLCGIFLEYATGAVRRHGQVWIDYNLFSDSALSAPFTLESPAITIKYGGTTMSSLASEKRDYLMGELTWPEARERLKEVDVALLPVGSLEQHGSHLPLDTDSFDAEYLAQQVAAKCSNPKPLVLPLIPYGISYHHEDFIGTISVSNETLSRVVYEIGMGAARNGITKLIIINGHGGNAPALKFAAQMINRDAHIFVCVDTGETSDADLVDLVETPNDVHAGEIETSIGLVIRPHLVKLDRAKKYVPKFSSRYLNFSTKRSVEWYARTAKISRNGVLGDPTKASKDKGEKIWAIMVKNLVELIEDLKRLTLDEIYEKRY